MTPPLPVGCKAAVTHLKKADPVLAGAIARVGPCEVIPIAKVDLFQALLRSIIYQQLHPKAAGAIHARVLALMPKGASAAAFQTLSDEPIRRAGLSTNKLLAVRDLVTKSLDGTIPPIELLQELDDEELIARFTTVRGVGPWTVQMLMIFHLGRPDVMPTGDFAIRKSFSMLYRRGRAVKPDAILRHARRWRPYRSIASWYLWRSLDIERST